jgi:rod shape-determining protein MreD
MTKYRAIRWTAYVLELMAVFVLQETPGLLPAVRGVRPLAVLPAALSVAMFEEENPAMVFGLFAGLLMDFGYGSILGFHGLLLAVVCRAVSRMVSDLFRTSFLTALLISAVVSAGLALLQWTCFYVLPGYGSVGYALGMHYLPIAAYTFVLMPVAYYFNRAIAVQIREKEA